MPKNNKKTSLTTLIKSRKFYNRTIGKRDIKKPLKLVSTESDNEKQKIKKIRNAKSSMQTVIRGIKKYVDENNLPNQNFASKISSKPTIIYDKIIVPASENNSETENNERAEFLVLKENVMHATDQFHREDNITNNTDATVLYSLPLNTNIISDSLHILNNFSTQEETTPNKINKHLTEPVINLANYQPLKQGYLNNQSPQVKPCSGNYLNRDNSEPTSSDCFPSNNLSGSHDKDLFHFGRNDESNSTVVMNFHTQDINQNSKTYTPLETPKVRTHAHIKKKKQDICDLNSNQLLDNEKYNSSDTELNQSENQDSSDYCSNIIGNNDNDEENTQLIRSFINVTENMPTKKDIRNLIDQMKQLQRLLERQNRRELMPQKPDIFPLETIEAVNNFESVNDCLYDQVVDYFRFLGGTNVMEAVNFCVKRSLSDNAVKHYSVWGEQNENEAFYNKKICKAIFDGICVNSCYPRPTEQQFLHAIAEAIRYAKQRIRNHMHYPPKNVTHRGRRICNRQKAKTIFGNEEESADATNEDNNYLN